MIARGLMIAAVALVLVSCARSLYTGTSYYYHDQQGTRYECREPAPWQGGNCKEISKWKQRSLSE